LTVEETKRRIWKFQKPLEDKDDKAYWTNIIFSISTIGNAVQKFTVEEEHEVAIGYAKLIVMELWTIRELLVCLEVDLEEFESEFHNVKKFRDAYAHIKERIQGKEKPFRQPKRELKWEDRSIAGGRLTSADGQNWDSNAKNRIFNIEFNGNKGAMSIFGIIDNFLICNSGEELQEIELDETMLKKLLDILNKACD